jgi:hypothetical protein
LATPNSRAAWAKLQRNSISLGGADATNILYHAGQRFCPVLDDNRPILVQFLAFRAVPFLKILHPAKRHDRSARPWGGLGRTLVFRIIVLGIWRYLKITRERPELRENSKPRGALDASTWSDFFFRPDSHDLQASIAADDIGKNLPTRPSVSQLVRLGSTARKRSSRLPGTSLFNFVRQILELPVSVDQRI